MLNCRLGWQWYYEDEDDRGGGGGCADDFADGAVG